MLALELTATSLPAYLMLAGAGALAGVVNAIAGGGGIFSFTALIGLGLPPVMASATTAVGLMPANISSSIAYRDEIRRRWKDLIGLACRGVCGGAIGAVLLIQTGNEAFAKLVPWLLLVSTLLYAGSRWFPLLARANPGRRRGATSIVQLLISIYGGFFNAGMGIVVLAGLSLVQKGDYHTLNASKNVLSVCVQLFGNLLLVVAGIVSWKAALVVAVFSSIGGYLGVSFGRRMPRASIQVMVVSMGLALTGYFFVREW